MPRSNFRVEFAGPTLYFGVLGVFERYLRYATVFDNPHSHPPAYERLHRLRVRLAMGDGHQYWSVKSGDGFQLAGMDLDANPEAIRFADALSASLLAVLEGVEAERDMPSPLLTLVNRFGDRELSETSKSEFRSEICRWLALGSPKKVIQHLREGHNSAAQNIFSVKNEGDRVFWVNSDAYLSDSIDYISQIEDRTVQGALQKTQVAERD